MNRLILTLSLTLLAGPAAAWAQSKAETPPAEKRLAALEAQLQALLKEVQALRGEQRVGADAAARKAEAVREFESARKEAEMKARAMAEKAAADAKAALKKALEAEEKAKKDVERKVEIEIVPKLKKELLELELQLDKMPKAAEEMKRLQAEMAEWKKKLQEFEFDKFKDLKKLGVEEMQKKLDSLQLEKLMELRKAEELKGRLRIEADPKAIELKAREALDKAREKVKEAADKPAETKEKRVIVVDGAPPAIVRSGDGSTQLTRRTYTLNAEQAQAIADFLKAHAKTAVLEMKVEGEKLTVTTTPDVQATVAGVVGLVTGKPVAGPLLRTTQAPPKQPVPPVPPTPPARPSVPLKPAKPADKD